MAINKVELCGVNTSRLPVLNAEEKETLLKKAREGDAAARERYIQGNLRLVLSVIKPQALLRALPAFCTKLRPDGRSAGCPLSSEPLPPAAPA